ncbi:MAG: hypothetical protein JW943_09200 [Deltaproteobacteria bacterium]|nr:hypothetical protein [Deltaproteobacteria bacterium]
MVKNNDYWGQTGVIIAYRIAQVLDVWDIKMDFARKDMHYVAGCSLKTAGED